ncbi:(2Fe-2S)-binding protein [Bacillus badius]|uniref:Carbon monoxide dehydrogenase small chain n=1 Tax=Bacillus badius TaxID=1455 RepID=A0ABR5AUF1_BACBA|nr:(2Fe-2S)-binding protein [Bacillus badius]KIL76703.1 Carbon monoxide dehydrogenase small chain [Bacillus badius]KIL78365.1 Carbon monoxide dehydrogenase small chain [Bacillus badius]KZR57707.1 carbon monoxide dehydrogenase [Bacillus badius]MED4715888.1 (2Fe-2S)-binding protein [Bacillus badius]
MAIENRKVTVTVNGQERSAEVEPRKLLVHYLRDDLGLTGTHIGCDTSQCGACTIMVNGAAVKSCTMLAVQADKSELTTVEGLGTIDHLHPMQQSFWEEHGLQCGYCTPGVMMAMIGLLQENPNPSEEEIREGMEGVICRCTGYQFIVSAVQKAAKIMAEAAAKDGEAVAASQLVGEGTHRG